MSDETTANPEGAVHTEETSVQKVAKMLERPAPTDVKRPKEDPKANRPEKTTAKAPTEAQPDPDPEEPEAEPEDPDSTVEGEEQPLELPETLEDLADALGLKPEDFLAKLKGKVKVNGVEQHVNLAEALKGYQLEADYRQKTAQLNESKSKHETETRQAKEAISQRLKMADDMVALLAQQLHQGPSEAEMRQLLNEDPIQYQRVKAELDLRKDALNQAWQQLQRHKQEESESLRQQRYEARREQQQKLVAALPVFGDESKRTSYEANVRAALKAVDYTDEEIGAYFHPENVFDYRHLRLIDKAMKWDAFEAGKKNPDIKKRLQALPPVKAKPNPSSDNLKEDQRTALRERLRKHGSRRGGAEDVSIALVKTML